MTNEIEIIKGKFSKTPLYVTSAILGAFFILYIYELLFDGSLKDGIVGLAMTTGIFAIILFLVYRSISKKELVVTEKRVYGVTKFGKRVDLPMDSISSVSQKKKRVSVATASGVVSFSGLLNADLIFNEINIAISNRQDSKIETQNNNSDNYDELKKLSTLLNEGIITQEEFDAKKKELLGL